MADLIKTIKLVIGLITTISFFTGAAINWNALLTIRDRTLLPVDDYYNLATRAYYNAFDRAVPLLVQRKYVLSYFLLTFTIAGWCIIAFLSADYTSTALSAVVSCILLWTSVQTWMRFRKANKPWRGDF